MPGGARCYQRRPARRSLRSSHLETVCVQTPHCPRTSLRGGAHGLAVWGRALGPIFSRGDRPLNKEGADSGGRSQRPANSPVRGTDLLGGTAAIRTFYHGDNHFSSGQQKGRPLKQTALRWRIIRLAPFPTCQFHHRGSFGKVVDRALKRRAIVGISVGIGGFDGCRSRAR